MPEEKLKNAFWSILVVLLLVITVGVILSLPLIIRYTNSLISVRTISVSGEGKVVAEPDIAKFTFSVVSEGTNPELLQADNTKKMNQAIDYVKSQGVDAKDIKTTQYNLSPRYEYDEVRKKSFISGYTLTQTVLVKVRDLNKIAKILGGLPEFGINQINSISFEVDEPEKYLAEARAEAFKKAQAKADELVKQNGVRLGRVISFSDYGAPYPYPVYNGGMKMEGLGGAGAPTPPSIEPGTQEVTVQVSVTYEIK